MPQDDPPIARNTPPTSGSIAWARRLFARIEEPMVIFKDDDAVMKSDDSLRIVRLYNKVVSSSLKLHKS